jgi:hypothetical protein
MSSTPLQIAWNPITRIAFRFTFIYFLLFAAAGILQLIPVVGGRIGYLLTTWEQPLIVWVGRAVFDLTITVFPAGSGDTTFNYVQVATHAAVAGALTLVWSLIDWRRPSYPWLKDGLWIAMRFVLASTMLGYGINKIFALQFPAPTMTRLLQNYGDSSPMGLLWTFMGASGPYTMFAGWMETIGGLLLLFRRTMLLGALWIAGVMTNVFMLNMCYDVPVKLYSLHLLLTALVIAAPDMHRVVRVFLLNREVGASNLIGPWTWKPLRYGALAVKLLWIGYSIPIVFWSQYQAQYQYGALAPVGRFDGTWEVTNMTRDGKEVPALVSESTRWRYVTMFDRPMAQRLSITPMRGTVSRWTASFPAPNTGPSGENAQSGRIELTEATAPPNTSPTTSLEFAFEEDGSLRLSGTIDGSAVDARCKKKEGSEFLLMNRGFHWVNEFPFNR